MHHVAGMVLPLMRPFPLYMKDPRNNSKKRRAKRRKNKKKLSHDPNAVTINLLSSSEQEEGEEDEEEEEPEDNESADEEEEENESEDEEEEKQVQVRDRVAPFHLNRGNSRQTNEEYASDDDVLCGITAGAIPPKHTMQQYYGRAPVMSTLPHHVYNCQTMNQVNFYKGPDSNVNVHHNPTDQQVKFVFFTFVYKFFP